MDRRAAPGRGSPRQVVGDYNEPELNALEDQLNIDNQNIRQAFENFMEARALVREARSHYFPTVSVGGSYTRSRTSSNVGSASSTGGTGGKQSQLFSLPGDISWEPDLWDKVRNTVRASQYTAQLTAADLENERLTEQASLAQYFFEIRGQDALQKSSMTQWRPTRKHSKLCGLLMTLAWRPDLRCRSADNFGERAIRGNQSRNCASAV
jgi:outer membrane protein TolC